MLWQRQWCLRNFIYFFIQEKEIKTRSPWLIAVKYRGEKIWCDKKKLNQLFNMELNSKFSIFSKGLDFIFNLGATYFYIVSFERVKEHIYIYELETAHCSTFLSIIVHFLFLENFAFQYCYCSSQCFFFSCFCITVKEVFHMHKKIILSCIYMDLKRLLSYCWQNIYKPKKKKKCE